MKINRYKLNRNQLLNIIVFTLLFVNVINFQTNAQITIPKKLPNGIALQAADTIPKLDSLSMATPTDSLGIIAPDSTLRSFLDNELALDSIKPIPVIPVGDIKTTVHYRSGDSLTINMITKDVKMFGAANINYSPITITAEEITVNWQDNLMMAEGKVDSTGRKYGTPIFLNGAETYETDEIKYNFKTEKAAIKGLVTTQGDGFIHADQVFKNAQGELFNKTTLYTTCNLAHPHYSIKARKVKVIPGKVMISGPFNMIVNDVPLPLGFFFGIFPDQQHRNSGIIFPTFGEETRRGFYLRQGGYYFAINDYINLDLTGDIYTRGGWAVRATSAYNKRYSFRGNILFNFTKLRTENESTLETTESNDFRFSWAHTPISKGTGRFSASVDLASSSYSDNNILANPIDQTKTNLSSRVNYSKSFTGTPISLGVSASFNQNLNTKLANIVLPDFNLNVQNIYPFKKQGSSGRAWYEKIVFRYSMNASNKITNRIITADGDSIVELNAETLPLLIKQGSNGFNHQIPISTSLSLFKHFKLNPSLNYQERWYFKKLDYSYDEESQKIVTDTINGFTAVRSYQAAVGITSIIYGTVFFKREYGVQAIRHQMIPSISYSYRPDFGDPKFDYFQEVQSDNLGNTRTLSRYAGFVYGSPGRGKSSNIGFSLTNTLEMKFRNRKDTTGKAEKIILLRNFGLSTGYNLAVDSFQLAPISINASTNIFDNKPLGKSATTTGFNINFRGTIDPYLYVLDSITGEGTTQVVHQRRLNQFAFNNGQGLGQFSSFNISISTGFRAKTKGSTQGARGGGRDTGGDISQTRTTNQKEEQELLDIMTNPDLYVDFKIPWSIRFNYNVNFTRVGFKEGKVTQSLRFSGDLSLTQKWKMTFNSGYDFERKKFNETRLGITRDLHCWEMRLDWVPYGRFQSYNFTIRAKSSLLQDLKISKKRNATDSFTFQ